MALVAADCYPEALFGGGRELDFSNLDYSEQMISTLPVVVRRRVKFGECDPAGVVYTPIFSEYTLSTYQWFLSGHAGRTDVRGHEAGRLRFSDQGADLRIPQHAGRQSRSST